MQTELDEVKKIFEDFTPFKDEFKNNTLYCEDFDKFSFLNIDKSGSSYVLNISTEDIIVKDFSKILKVLQSIKELEE